MNETKKQVVWVDADIAEKLKAAETTKNQRDTQVALFDEYIKSLTQRTQDEFRVQLEGLDEDSQMFTGLLLRVKQTYEKTLNEQKTANYELWEKFQAELPKEREKVKAMVDVLNPLLAALKEINSELKKINTWEADKFLETLRSLSGLCGTNLDMVKFLVSSYKKPESKEE